MNDNSGDAKLSRKEREFLARRKEIINAAVKVFAEKGYHGAAMSEIAKEAEFSTGSLYNFFKNKEELYFSLLSEKIDALESQVDQAMEEADGIEDKLNNFVVTILGFFERERYFFKIFAEQRSNFDFSSKGFFADVVQEKYQQYLLKMVKIMQQGLDEGLFKPMAPAELAMTFIGIMHTLLFIYVNADQPYPLQEKAPLALDIFFNGTRRRSNMEDKA